MARKISLDSKAIKTFLFMHIEKLVLGVAGVLLLYFLWLGMSTKPYTAQTPAGLKKLAKDADQYIESPNAWTDVSQFRKGDDKAEARIKAAASNVLKADDYTPIRSAPKEKQASLRGDPELYKANDYELLARPFRATIFVQSQTPNNMLDKLERASMTKSAAITGGGKGGGGKGGSPSSPGDMQQDNEETADTKAPKKLIMPFGDQVLTLHRLEIPGVRPQNLANSDRLVPAPYSIVEVVGVVPFENEWTRFDQIFSDARDYLASRDRPRHAFLEVQRKMVDEADDSWITINKSKEGAANDPFDGVSSPELIDPNFFDATLTKPLPPFAYFDYTSIASHPKVPLRNLRPADMFSSNEKVEARFDPNRAFGKNNIEDKDETKGLNPQEDIENLKGSSDALYKIAQASTKPKAPYKLIRFFDYNPPKAGEFQYRVRVWFLDANNPPELALNGASNKGGDGNMPGGKGGGAGAPGGKGGGVGAPGGKGGGVGAPGGKGMAGAGAPGGQDQSEMAQGSAFSTEDDYFFSPVDRKSLTSDVRNRLDKQREQDYIASLPDPQLVNAVAAEWSTPTAPVSVEQLKNQSVSEVYAGFVNRDRKTSLGGTEFSKNEPSASIVVNSVLDGLYTYVPFKREVLRGDVLNFTTDLVYLLHPLDWTVRKQENASVKSNILVVDIIGGDEARMRDLGAQDVEPNPIDGFEPEDSMGSVIPGEVLLMDSYGNLSIQDSAEDYGRYRSALFLPDESNSFGKSKRKEEEDDTGAGGKGAGGKGKGGK